MKYDLQICALSYVVELGKVTYKNLPVAISICAYDYLNVDFRSRDRKGSLVFSDLGHTAKLRIPMETSRFAFISARTQNAAEMLLKKVVSLLRGLYNIVEKPIMKLLRPIAKARLNINRKNPLNLAEINRRFRALGYKVVYSDEDRGYELSLYIDRAVAKLTTFGKILLFGFANYLQMYRVITLLKSICSLSQCEEKALHYLEEYRLARTDVGFTLMKKRIPLQEIAPSQSTVNRLDVIIYKELIARGLNPEVCVLETLLNEKPYALIDGHHRAKACHESDRNYVDTFVICPSKAIASRVVENARFDGVFGIVDLKLCD